MITELPPQIELGSKFGAIIQVVIMQQKSISALVKDEQGRALAFHAFGSAEECITALESQFGAKNTHLINSLLSGQDSSGETTVVQRRFRQYLGKDESISRTEERFHQDGSVSVTLYTVEELVNKYLGRFDFDEEAKFKAWLRRMFEGKKDLDPKSYYTDFPFDASTISL
jgi:hypothetical protein